MFAEMWRLLTDFLRDFTRALVFGIREHWKGIAIFSVLAFFGMIALVIVVFEATASPKFCASCHNMGTYIESWEQSTHRDVGCLECHFEPGVWGTLKGKWRAQAHLVMVITGTAPPRPHTQISDISCLRNGCHSVGELSEAENRFKGVDFSHGTHVGELRRGKRLKCVTCHSQIVQGEHLTVTESTCFTCHFYKPEEHPEMGECQLCHQETKAKIFIGANENLPFVHKEYLDRGVPCGQCHFDVVFGDGHLKDNICIQCHAEPEFLMGTFESEEIHLNHVALHKVECFRCHAEIDHGVLRPGEERKDLPDRATAMAALAGYHYDTNCSKCHSFDQHESIRLMYTGTGAEGVPDMPSPMYLAHADCGTCHVYEGDVRFGFDEVVQSCSDCHGTGYDDMARHWKELLTDEIRKTEGALLNARNALAENRNSENAGEAIRLLDQADENLAFTRQGRGLHNIDYALKVLAASRRGAEEAKVLLLPSYVAQVVESPDGCTQLCHNCVECIETQPVPFGNVQFPHDIHVSDEGFTCEECHTPRSQHGHTVLENCNECHHGSGAGAVECQDCHVENHNLYNGQNACDEASCDVRGEANVMIDAVECIDCHTSIVDEGEHDLASVKQTCVDCHDEDYAAMTDDWIAEAEQLEIDQLYEMLQDTQRMVLSAIRDGRYTYDAQDMVNAAEKNLLLMVKGNAVHNLPFAKDLVGRVRTLLEEAQKTLHKYSTVQTLPREKYL